MMHSEYIRRTIELAEGNIDAGGGPFGALIVKEGKIIAEASNRVTPENDPTAHAEVLAIREAARRLNSYDLSGCTLYASCEPCPMCLGAIYWARIQEVYYASDREDAEKAGFDDSVIYKEIGKEPGERQLRMVRIEEPAAGRLFRRWIEKEDKQRY
jgi:guanine deaminase